VRYPAYPHGRHTSGHLTCVRHGRRPPAHNQHGHGAGQAASTPGVCRHAAGLDKLTGRDLPAAQLEISANRAVAQLKVAIAWPHPLAEVARAVPRTVTEAFSALAGLDVDRVDVEVTHVSVADTNGAPGRVL
jgi:uncharacterized alkaline shock family protein YloU